MTFGGIDSLVSRIMMSALLPLPFYLITFYIVICPQLAIGANILGFPSLGGSQYIGIKRISEELTRRGHNVTILISSAQLSKYVDTSDGIVHHAVYQVPYKKEILEKELVKNIVKKNYYDILFGNDSIVEINRVLCESLLRDSKLLNNFRKFDLLISASLIFCGPLVADFLNVMRIEYCTVTPSYLFLPFSYESLSTLSYVPQINSANPRIMNFVQRLKNILVFLSGQILLRYSFSKPFQELKIKYNIQPNRSYLEAMQDAELKLFLADFSLNYPHPVLPGYKLIGPLNIQPVKPLPPDLQQLIDSSGDDGVIIVSFGSNIDSVGNKEKVDIMAEAFGRLKQKVIWRLQGYIPSSLSPNIKPVQWLPQNDLLAHNKLRVFVSHVGHNSIHEAAYRGVPVVALPFFGDQFDNAVLLEERGLGLKLDYQTLTADDMYNTIQRVIQEPRFKENAERISRLLSDRPRSPAQEAADWIEYTLRHGGLAHLRPYSSQLAWYQYFLVDVVVFLMLIVLLVILLIKYTVRFVCWLCCRSRNDKLKTQ